jgi:hypothetical protein
MISWSGAERGASENLTLHKPGLRPAYVTSAAIHACEREVRHAFGAVLA